MERDIPKDTLLMVSKAFKVVFRINFLQVFLKKLVTEPEFCQNMYQLYAGPNFVLMEKLDEDVLR